MKVEPLHSFSPRDFALLTPGQRCLYVETTWGKKLYRGARDVTLALEKLSGFTCYVASNLERFKVATPATEWTLHTWREKPVKMVHGPSGTVITSLRSTLEGSDDPFRDLNETLSWLRQYGIPPASLSSMSWKLFRASLSDDVVISTDPEVTAPSFFGPRQQIKKPGLYSDMESIDIKAAYPSAMAVRPFALSLRKVDASTTIDPNQAGLARARVNVPRDLSFAPLPVRLSEQAIQFQWGEIEGTWSWIELNAAQELGCDVEVLESWAPGRTMDLFSTWWEMAREGRDLPGSAAVLAKAIANSTWGQFAMKGTQRSTVGWADAKGNEAFELALDDRVMPHRFALNIASEVTARVRCQTLLEGLYGSQGLVVHVDTDGIICDQSAPIPKNFGTEFGQWRIKEKMSVIDLKAPQLYRFQTTTETAPVSDPWHYVASGMNHDAAQRFFGAAEASETSYLSMSDVCIPSTSADDQAMIDRLLREARRLGVS